MTTSPPPQTITLHSRTYTLPSRPTIIICIDGFDPTYLHHGTSTLAPTHPHHLPTFSSLLKTGFHAPALSAMPSLTNPNNLSIITGAPTAAHGVAGNYYLDTSTGLEHMITDATMVRGDSTILAELQRAGVRVAAVTAKDKLRRILCYGLGFGGDNGAICFSAQNARDATVDEHGIEGVERWLGQKQPEQYSAELSLFVLDAGVKLLEEGRAEVMYLTLSDYVQHKYAPEEEEAEVFMKAIDERIGRFIELGAVVAVSGDHGMSDKCAEDGEVNVLFLEDVLAEKWAECRGRVICPIADPFVKHHGALGGFVRVHFLGKRPDEKKMEEILGYVRDLPEVEVAYTGEEAASIFEMPLDREGDMVVISRKNAVIGARSDEHDLAGLKDHRLRSHGGLSEQAIPLLRSEPLKGPAKKDGWRNFDLFDVALNYW